ncbi:major capsid protein, partial [Xanthomonas citri pv. citri]|nr:major capsid protein [Xanthomonas citri pv. citri]
LSDDYLDGIASSGKRVFCSRSFYDALVNHPNVIAAWAAFNDGEILRAAQGSVFYHAGCYFEEYKGKVGGISFIEDGAAYM